MTNAPIILAAIAGAACATDHSRGEVEAVTGEQVYRSHCVSCHGETAHGDGPVAKFLAPRPADLTQISQRRGGEFPAIEIRRIIDGGRQSFVHGPKDMPVWGRREGGANDTAAKAEAAARITALVDYLRTIQRP